MLFPIPNLLHERPGVYSSYDTSSVSRRSTSYRSIALLAHSTGGSANTPVTLTSYENGLAAFGVDSGFAGMSTLLKLLFHSRSVTVVAVPVADGDYASALTAIASMDGISLVVCDSGELSVHQLLKNHVTSCSAARRERIAVVGTVSCSADELIAHANALNSERMLLVAPGVLGEDGMNLSGICAAAATAAAISAAADPAVPLHGSPLYGLGGTSLSYSDTEIDCLVRGGVTPLECSGGTVSPIRCVTTRTTTGGADDATWRELSTILIIDTVIPAIRSSLRAQFAQAKNNQQTRGAIRSHVILLLESFLKGEIIDSYGEVAVAASDTDPTVCQVEFPFAVAHGLNHIVLTAHIAV